MRVCLCLKKSRIFVETATIGRIVETVRMIIPIVIQLLKNLILSVVELVYTVRQVGFGV